MKKIAHLSRVALPLVVGGLLLSLAGCDSYFEDLNTPEDQLVASEVDESLLGQSLAYAQFHAMRGFHGGGGYNQIQIHYADNFVQYFAPVAPNHVSDNFEVVSRWDDLGWTYFYERAAKQIKFVEDQTAENGLDVGNAVAKVWRVAAYHQMTDVWGPIPYSAFGNSEVAVPYDSQESIYRDFFTTLDEAVAVLEENPGDRVFGASELMYEGNVDQWLTFANALRLRLAMRVRYAAPDLAQQEAEKAVAAGVMMDPADNAMLATSENSPHPLRTITGWGEFRMGAAMESVLEGYEDPRMENYYLPSEDGDSDGDGSPYEGLRNGLPQAQRNPGQLSGLYAEMGQIWQPAEEGGSNPPIQVMRAAECYFLRAEGALQGWSMGGTAEELYDEGIRVSMRDRTSATEEQIEAYVSSENLPIAVGDEFDTPPLTDIPVAFDAGGSMERKLEQIITQKWLAIYPDGWEAWAEYRRTEYPQLYPLIQSNNPSIPADGIFRRLTFVPGEISNNLQAVEAARSMLEGTDDNATRLWWDAKP